jgi:hypothetical protein
MPNLKYLIVKSKTMETNLLIKSLLGISIIITTLTPISTDAASYRVGSVKKRYQTEVCAILMPNSNMFFLYSPDDDGLTAWVNINNNDIRLKRKSMKVIKPRKHSISEYFGQGTRVVVESKHLRTISDALTTDESTDKVTFVKNGESRIIQGMGVCTS